MLVEITEIDLLVGDGKTRKVTFMGFAVMPPGRWGGQTGVIVCHDNGSLEQLAFEEVQFPPKPPRFLPAPKSADSTNVIIHNFPE